MTVVHPMVPNFSEHLGYPKSSCIIIIPDVTIANDFGTSKNLRYMRTNKSASRMLMIRNEYVLDIFQVTRDYFIVHEK